jgi:hypothetical protein
MVLIHLNGYKLEAPTCFHILVPYICNQLCNRFLLAKLIVWEHGGGGRISSNDFSHHAWPSIKNKTIWAACAVGGQGIHTFARSAVKLLTDYCGLRSTVTRRSLGPLSSLHEISAVRGLGKPWIIHGHAMDPPWIIQSETKVTPT